MFAAGLGDEFEGDRLCVDNVIYAAGCSWPGANIALLADYSGQLPRARRLVEAHDWHRLARKRMIGARKSLPCKSLASDIASFDRRVTMR
jgi:hypothetical protein